MMRWLDLKPYGERDDDGFLADMNALTEHHVQGCQTYRRILKSWKPADRIATLPFLHVELFKHLELRTQSHGIRHHRTLLSSSTSGNTASKIILDNKSSILQSRSSNLILREFLSAGQRPLIVLDNAGSLRRRGEVSARVAAALALRPFATEIHFALSDGNNDLYVDWDKIRSLLENNDSILVYGFTTMLWEGWGEMLEKETVSLNLEGKTVDFVHSGGWKRLEGSRIERNRFDDALLKDLSTESRVIEYYGLVEQVGIVYPRCSQGFFHVPIWADVLVRDSYTGESVEGEVGQLQLMNLLAYGSPYHNVLTEDMGKIIGERCNCGRSGKKFELLGRIPRAELRGCANV